MGMGYPEPPEGHGSPYAPRMPPRGTVTVKYATANGTAQAGSDYVATSGVLTFAAGQLVQTVSVAVRGDRVKEGHETFFVNLSGPSGATLLDGSGLGTIGNDDERAGGWTGSQPLRWLVNKDKLTIIPPMEALPGGGLTSPYRRPPVA